MLSMVNYKFSAMRTLLILMIVALVKLSAGAQTIAETPQGVVMVDENGNQVRVSGLTAGAVLDLVVKRGFETVFNQFAGISSSGDMPKIKLPKRRLFESEQHHARRVLEAVGHPAAASDDKKRVVHIARVIIKREE